jgi:hypothetical protein
MLTTFTLLVVTGGVLRLALGWGLHPLPLGLTLGLLFPDLLFRRD